MTLLLLLFVCFHRRSMDSLACLNIVGLAAVILLAAVAALLGVSAVATGTAHAIPMMPQWQLLGPTKEVQLEAMAGVLPVILASYVVHQVGYRSHSCWIGRPRAQPAEALLHLRCHQTMPATIQRYAVNIHWQFFNCEHYHNQLQKWCTAVMPTRRSMSAKLITLLLLLLVVVCSASLTTLQNLHPAMPLLRPYTPSRMCGVVAIALGISASVFVALSVGSSLAFGIDQLATNVLSNFSAEDLAPFVGHAGGEVLSWVIRGGYLVSVLGSLLLYMYPLRSCVAEVIWGAGRPLVTSEDKPSPRAGSCDDHDAAAACSYQINATLDGSSVRSSSIESVDATVMLSVGSSGSWIGEVTEDREIAHGMESVALMQQQQEQPRWQRLEQRWYYTLTYGLLVSMVLVAVLVPSIWSALSLIGDLACTTQAFMLPGAIALVLVFKHGLASCVLPASAAPQAAATTALEPVLQAAVLAGAVDSAFRGVADSDATDASMVQPPEGAPCCSSELQQPDEEVVLVLGPLHPPLLRLGSRRFGMLQLLQGQQQGEQQLHSLDASNGISAVRHLGADSSSALAGHMKAAAGHVSHVAYVLLSGLIVLLGMVLFANGVWQRV
jgi:hypothetical protein